MGETSIEWTDRTWNPVRGCRRVSPGCENCYAERQAHRFSGPGGAYEGLTKLTKRGPVWTGKARFVPEKLAEPLGWQKPQRIFVNSMSDLFHEDLTNEQIAAVFGVMAACPKHTFQVLTKRSARMRAWFDWAADIMRVPSPSVEAGQTTQPSWLLPYVPVHGGPIFCSGYRHVHEHGTWPLPNVWLGASAENQEAFDERIEHLMACPAAVQFLSLEPLLGDINIERFLYRASRFDYIWNDNPMSRDDHPERMWVIAGGESGPGARPTCLSWLRNIVHDCEEAGVPCFVKQLGAKPYEARDVGGVEEEKWEPEAWLNLADKKGGDAAEWIAFGESYLNVRQFPEVRHG